MSNQDQQFDDLLKSARAPDRSAGYWERFPGRVTARLSENRSADTSATPALLRLWGPWLVTAAVAVVLGVGLWLGNRSGRSERDYARLYREIAQMFPNQVRAIVVDGDGVRIELADRANVPPSVPLRVDVCHDRRCQTYITFSGQQIRVGDEPCDVLADGRGHVLVVGGNVVWTSAEPARNADGYQIAAAPLEASS